MEQAEVSLGDVLETHAVRLRQHTALSIHIDCEPTYIVGDEHDVTQLINDIVENAAEYATSSVDMNVYRQRGQAVIIVGDDRNGRAVVDASPGAVTSPGRLPAVARTVSRLHGTLLVDDRPGIGRLVTVILPVPHRS